MKDVRYRQLVQCHRQLGTKGYSSQSAEFLQCYSSNAMRYPRRGNTAEKAYQAKDRKECGTRRRNDGAHRIASNHQCKIHVLVRAEVVVR